jgi:hypothetical protein
MTKLHLTTTAAAALIIGFAGGNAAQVTGLLGEAKASVNDTRLERVSIFVDSTAIRTMTVNQLRQAVCDAADAKFGTSGVDACKKIQVKQLMIDRLNTEAPAGQETVVGIVSFPVVVTYGSEP